MQIMIVLFVDNNNRLPICEHNIPPAVGKSALKAPDLGPDCSFCCWVSWPRLR